MQKYASPRADGRQDGVLLLVGADPHDERPALTVGNPVGADRRARGQHLFQHDVAFERAPLLAAVALGPGHPNPAALAHAAAEGGIVAVPAFGALPGRAVGELGFQEVSHLGAHALPLG